jgi:hypothetical protein
MNIATKLEWPQDPISKVEFRASGLGAMRSTGEIITLLLSLEDPYERAEIVAHVIREMRVDFEVVTDCMDQRPCPRCHLDRKSFCERRGYCEER